MTTTTERLLDAGTVEEVRARRCTVVTGGGHAIAVFPLGDRFAAVDNRWSPHGLPPGQGHRQQRNPHLPLAPRQVRPLQRRHLRPLRRQCEGIPGHGVGRPGVGRSQPTGDRSRPGWSKRLEDGMEHNIRLVIAKSVLGLNSSPRRLPGRR